MVLFLRQVVPNPVKLEVEDVGEAVQAEHPEVVVGGGHLPRVEAEVEAVQQRTLPRDRAEDGSVPQDVIVVTLEVLSNLYCVTKAEKSVVMVKENSKFVEGRYL